MYNYAVFILTHKRVNKIVTDTTLRNCGYTGKIYYVVDDKDPQLDDYINKYGKESVLVFSKQVAKTMFDTMDNFDGDGAVVYARNICFQLAENLRLDYFIELDDDYTYFEIRNAENGILKSYKVSEMDSLFEAIGDFLFCSPNITSVALAQGGDLIGGCESSFYKMGLKRKAMNSFFIKTSKPFRFTGKINEDVNTYTKLGSTGDVFLTITNVDLVQVNTQSNDGGMTDTYIDNGTYVKSFYSVICMPSCVKINMMGDKHYRIHHSIDWESCVPKIVSSKFKVGG